MKMIKYENNLQETCNSFMYSNVAILVLLLSKYRSQLYLRVILAESIRHFTDNCNSRKCVVHSTLAFDEFRQNNYTKSLRARSWLFLR